MPVYEFLCRPCNRIFSFHSFRIDPDKVPVCPKCGSGEMRRVPSRFAAGRSATKAADGDDPGSEERAEREMMRLAAELEGMDENDPRQMARAVRRMTEIAGEPVTPAMEEMIRRMEAGEDPERIEEELGDALDDDMGGEGGGLGGAPDRDDGLYPM